MSRPVLLPLSSSLSHQPPRRPQVHLYSHSSLPLLFRRARQTPVQASTETGTVGLEAAEVVSCLILIHCEALNRFACPSSSLDPPSFLLLVWELSHQTSCPALKLRLLALGRARVSLLGCTARLSRGAPSLRTE